MPGRWRYRTATLAALAAVLLAAAGVAIGLSLNSSSSAPPAAKTATTPRVHTSTGTGHTPHPQPSHAAGNGGPAVPPATGALGRNSGSAAGWITDQVSPGTVVACDPQMCSELRAYGFPGQQEAHLGANSQSLSGASLVAVTPPLRTLFARGSAGNEVAPVVLASWGSGSALVTIQPVDPAGGSAYQAALSKDVQQRIQLGQELLNSGRVSAAPKARHALAVGEVDPRILLAIKAVVRQLPVKIAGFSNLGPGAGPGVPFRTANFVATDLSTGLPPVAYQHQLIALLRAHATSYPVLHATPITMRNGQRAVQIVYGAPSPLGLLGPS